MVEEEQKPVEKDEDVKTYLDEVRSERIALEAARDETKNLLTEYKNLKASEIMSGVTNSGDKEPEKVEESPEEYAKSLLTGK